MFDLALVIGVFALAAFMGFMSWQLRDDHQGFKFLYVGLMLLFLIFGAYQIALLPTVPEVRLNWTEEDSLYWNCSTLRYECEGKPSSEACLPYDQTQCNDISNCTWNANLVLCEGTPAVTCSWLGAYDTTGNKCTETAGCYWNLNYQEENCDSINVTYHYGNYSSGYEEFGEAAEGVAFVLMLVLVFFFLYFFLLFLVDAVRKVGKKPPQGEEEYATPY